MMIFFWFVIIAIAALVLGIANRRLLLVLRDRLDRLELEGAGRRERPVPMAPAPDLPFEEPVRSPTTPPVASPDPSPVTKTAPSLPAPRPRPRSRWLEQGLTNRLPVWLGALALALAGAFLVKYTVDHGLIGPTARVALGFVFGIGMVGAAEWLRTRAATVAQGLAAAGVAVVYATILGGTNLWEVIPSSLGFALMAGNTALGVILSLRHGPMVAILGMVGGFLTPAWIGQDDPAPGLLFTYLFLLQVGLLTVAARKRWWGLALPTLVGSVAWTGLWLVTWDPTVSSSLSMRVFVLASLAAFVLASRSFASDADARARHMATGLVWGSAASAIVLMGGTLFVADFAPVEWAYLGILGAGCLVLARIDQRYEGLAGIAAAGTAALLLAWVGAGVGEGGGSTFALTSLWMGALYTIGAYAAMWGSRRPDRWAVLSAASGVVYVLVAYAGIPPSVLDPPWSVVLLVVATLFVAAAIPVYRRRATLPSGDSALSAMAVGAAALAAIAVPMDLEREWITIAWALGVPLLVLTAARFRLPALIRVGWAVAGLVLIRLLLNPAVLDYPISNTPPWNWMLWGYGIPIASFALASRLCRRDGNRTLAEYLASGALALGFALVTLEVRHLFHPNGLMKPMDFGLMELGTYTVVWLAFGITLLVVHGRAGGNRRYLVAGGIAGGIALVQAIVAQGLAANPVWFSEPVGSMPVFNALLWLYGAPAALAALFAVLAGKAGQTVLARFAGAGSLALLFLTVTMEVRQAFHGTMLAGGAVSNAESYAYSAAWIVLALVLLAAGVVTRSSVLRVGSAVVMAMAVFKVFLVDTAALDGLYRVFSLLCLGASLLGLAYVYQRFVFRSPSESA
jgi:uncharacterized membrane protein